MNQRGHTVRFRLLRRQVGRFVLAVCVSVTATDEMSVYGQVLGVSNDGPGALSAQRIRHKGGPRITYGGTVYYSFPNYDIALLGLPFDPTSGGGFLSAAPGNIDQLLIGIGQESVGQGARVIMKNNRGMRWDGADLFIHPAYHHERVTQHHYWNRDLQHFGPPVPSTELSQRMEPPTTTSSSGLRTGTFSPSDTLDFIAQPWVVLEPEPVTSGGYYNENPPNVAGSPANGPGTRDKSGDSTTAPRKRP